MGDCLSATTRSTDNNWPSARVQHPSPRQPFQRRSNYKTPINNQGVSDGNYPQARSLEQRKARRPEVTPQAEGHLGYQHLPPKYTYQKVP